MEEDLGPRINGMTERDPIDDTSMQRRDLFKVGTLAALVSASNLSASQTAPSDGKVPEAKPGPALPTVSVGKYKVSRLIAGANPIYGYSHFNYVFSAHMTDYHTTDRVLAFLKEMERAGLNTWQASWSERLENDWLKYKEMGGKLQLFMLSRPGFNKEPEMLKRAIKLKPMGIAQHGGTTNELWDKGQFDKSLDYLKRIRDTGAMVGLSCHNPREVEYAEEKGWDVDYYMTCVYERHRTKAELEQLLGQAPIPVGEVYLPNDPPRMYKMIRQTRRTCLAFKILAAGRLSEHPEWVEQAFRETFAAIKPGDAVIVGMYDRESDQPAENAELVRRFGSHA